MVDFLKPPLTPAAMVDLFISRGMVVPDRNKAEHRLHNIGYYRLKGYSYVLTEDHTTHQLAEGTTFDQVLGFYIFDRKLRLLTMDAVERIEVALKANMCTAISTATNDPFWYMKPAHFKDQNYHSEFMESCADAFADSKDTFIENFKLKHPEYTLPPFWMIQEILSFGPISKAFKNLSEDWQRAVTAEYGIHRDVLASWFQAIHIVRNICAHHSQLWTRAMPKLLRITNGKRGKAFEKVDTSGFASRALVFVILLETIAPGSHWRKLFLKLLADFPQVDHRWLGFNDDPAKIFEMACPTPVQQEPALLAALEPRAAA